MALPVRPDPRVLLVPLERQEEPVLLALRVQRVLLVQLAPLPQFRVLRGPQEPQVQRVA